MRRQMQWVKNIISYLYLVFSFGILDAWLRVMTRWIGAYSIYSLAPNLFTLLWSLILAALITMIPFRRTRGIVYGVLYYVCMIYAVVQYGAYLILGKFLFLSDFLYTGEGLDYYSFIIDHISAGLIIQIIVLVFLGIIGIWSCIRKDQDICIKDRIGYMGVVGGIAIMSLNFVPMLYGNVSSEQHWDDFANPAAEYERFTNANFDLELAGMYQYLCKDMKTQWQRNTRATPENTAKIDAFFADKGEHSVNELSAVFEGKNLIVVMMESIDDWLVCEEDTPTIDYMMKNGIHFSNICMPGYSNGYTFNTEFAFNTSIYPYSNGNVAYSLSHNRFSRSMASQFQNEGYRVESFHKGNPQTYNRGEMHRAFGYSQYHCYAEYSEHEDEEILRASDTYVVENDALYSAIVEQEPFYSFIISYSAHLAYTDEELLTPYALEKHPEYDTDSDREMSILKVKARLTDDMFAGLLKRLEEDGLLQNTVIVGFSDHHVYGFSDKERVQRLSEEAGSPILERNLAFIYCAGYDKPMQIDKVMQTTDLAPTIMNLFGLDVPKDIMGQDVFDENYPGFAIFPNNTWLTNEAYMKAGTLMWNNGMTDEEIAQMNAYVQKVYEINDLILDTNYYANQTK